MRDSRCEVEVFSRVTGFFRPVQTWNKGKTEEFKDRKRFKMNPDMAVTSDDLSGITKTVTG